MGRTILLADDSKTIHKAIEMSFDKEDFEVVAVTSPAEALARCKELSPAVALLDLNFNDPTDARTGYDICAELKQDPACAGVPVILLYPSMGEYDEARGQEAGATAHLPKPFESQAIIDAVKGLADQAVAAPEPIAPEPIAPEPIAPEPIVAEAEFEAIAPEPPSPEALFEPIAELDPLSDDDLPEAELEPIAPEPDFPEAEFEPIAPEPPELDAVPEVILTPEPIEMPEAILTPEPIEMPELPELGVAPEAILTPDPFGDEDDFTSELEPVAPTAPAPMDTPLTPEPLEVPEADGVMELEPAVPPLQGAAVAPVEDRVLAQAVARVAPSGDVAQTQQALGALIYEVIERVAWEVVPDLAETIIREELDRLIQAKKQGGD